MVEKSRPWAGTTVGDRGPYSDDDWDDVWGILFGSEASPYNNRGVIRNWANGLAVTTPGANTARVATGAALVHGKFYRNTDDVDENIPTPGTNTRIDRIVLRSDWTEKTIRVDRIEGAEGSGVPPNLEQTDGVTWDIPLAQVSITTGDVITITDERVWASALLGPGLHPLGGDHHEADTLADLNAKVSDATLDGDTAKRPPSLGQFSITLEAPSATENICIGFTFVAVTVTEIQAEVQGTTPSVTINPKHSTDRSAAGNNILAAPTAITNTTTGQNLTAFDDPTIPADSWVWLVTTAKSGTVTELVVTIRYAVD